MAFLVVYHPSDRNKAIYLDQAFYEHIFEHCRRPNADFIYLRRIAELRYKSSAIEIDPAELTALANEIRRLKSIFSHAQIEDFLRVCEKAGESKLGLRISGDMCPEL